jgi:hypothetical protein
MVFEYFTLVILHPLNLIFFWVSDLFKSDHEQSLSYIYCLEDLIDLVMQFWDM